MAARHFKLKGWTRKPGARPYPFIPCTWLFNIDLDGIATAYASFFERWRLWGRDNYAVREGLDALAADYFIEYEKAELPAVELPYTYSAVFRNDALGPICLTLLQLGVKSRLSLLVEHSDRAASFGIAASRPIPHVLGPLLPNLVKISPKRFAQFAQGRGFNAYRLTCFSLPELVGVGKAAPLPLPPAAPAPLSPSSIVLGETIGSISKAAAGPAVVPLELLTRGTLVAGTTGSGKTNTVLKLIHEARPHVQGVLVLDIKREHRTLSKTLGARVYGFSGTNLLTHNLLKPLCPPTQWVKEFASILSEVISSNVPAVGGKDVAADELDKLYRERGVYDGSSDYPHIGDLLVRLQERATSSSKEREWAASPIRVLRTLNIGSTRQAFCVREGLALERLLEGVCVIELDGIGDPTGAALLTSILLQKIRHRLSGRPDGRLRNLIVIEEAQHILAEGQEATSVITNTCREIRAFGAGLVLVTQMPSAFSHHALANSNLLIAHRLSFPKDRWLMANMLGLEREAKGLLNTLDVGQALMRAENKLSLIRVPRIARPDVADDELPAIEVSREEVSTQFGSRIDVHARAADFGPLEWNVLVAVAEGHAVYAASIREHLDVPHSQLSPILSRFVRRGLLRYVHARNAAGGRPPAIYFLSPAGEEAFRSRFGRYPDRKPSRSPNHGELVQAVLRKLGITRKQHPRFDILYDEGSAERAIEVETGSNNDAQIRENLEKLLELQGEAYFVAVDRQTYNRIMQTGARYVFDKRGPLLLRVATVDALPEWDKYRFEPASCTS